MLCLSLLLLYLTSIAPKVLVCPRVLSSVSTGLCVYRDQYSLAHYAVAGGQSKPPKPLSFQEAHTSEAVVTTLMCLFLCKYLTLILC